MFPGAPPCACGPLFVKIKHTHTMNLLHFQNLEEMFPWTWTKRNNTFRLIIFGSFYFTTNSCSGNKAGQMQVKFMTEWTLEQMEQRLLVTRSSWNGTQTGGCWDHRQTEKPSSFNLNNMCLWWTHCWPDPDPSPSAKQTNVMWMKFLILRNYSFFWLKLNF